MKIKLLFKIPQASFTYQKFSSLGSGIIKFLDKSKNNPTSWFWNFGDGSTSSEQNPFHKFPKSGFYKVTLKVSNEYGSSKISKMIFIITITDSSGIPTEYKDRVIDWGIAGVWENRVKGIPERTQIFCNVRQSIPGSSLIAYGDGVHDDTSALQAAINLCPAGQVVYIPKGTYLVSGSLTISKGIVLRGEVGTDNYPLTIIIQNTTLGSDSGTIIISGSSYTPPFTNVKSGFAKGSTTITVESASAFKSNNIVIMDELNNPDLVTQYGRVGDNGDLNQCTWAGRISGGERAYGETFLIQAISGNTITLNRPIYWNFSSNLQPQLYLRSSSPVYYAGIENIHLVANSSITDGSGIIMQYCAYCWVKNCEIESFPRRNIWIRFGAYGCEVRHSYIHNKSTDTSSTFMSNMRYGILLESGSTNCLIEDNIIYYHLTGMILGVGCVGNVIGYNYVSTSRYGDTTWKTPDIATHAPHNYMNLFEGNVAGIAEFDVYWGSGSHHMVFRNWFHTQNPDWYVNQPRVAITCEGWNRYSSFIGNVLGYPGIVEAESPWSVYYEQIPFTDPYQKVFMWKVGLWNGAKGTAEANGDPITVSTIIRHKNYDFVRNQVDYDNKVGDMVLQPSLYLKSKPSWFGDLPWPVIGPDVNPVNGKIPAQIRFESKNYFTNN